jgi:hypothetical protein
LHRCGCWCGCWCRRRFRRQWRWRAPATFPRPPAPASSVTPASPSATAAPPSTTPVHRSGSARRWRGDVQQTTAPSGVSLGADAAAVALRRGCTFHLPDDAPSVLHGADTGDWLMCGPAQDRVRTEKAEGAIFLPIGAI